MDLLVGLEVAEVDLLKAEGCVQRGLVDVKEHEQIVPTALVVDLESKGLILALSLCPLELHIRALLLVM